MRVEVVRGDGATGANDVGVRDWAWTRGTAAAFWF
jgi:hypothetical protein